MSLAPPPSRTVNVNTWRPAVPVLGPTDAGCEPDITRFIAEPRLAGAPAPGLSPMTLPPGTVLLKAVVIVPTVKPAPVIVDAAEACVIPTTFGTTTCDGVST